MEPTRRALLQGFAAAALLPRAALGQAAAAPLTKPIPKTGEALPVIGLGTWISFNVGRDTALLDECAAIIAAFFDAGGRMIDSSPMYGSSQPTIGYGLKKVGPSPALFSAEKVWISDDDGGPEQMEASRGYWGVARFDLMQVHNLLSWERHLPRLFAMKAEGRLRYVGVTTSHGRRHDDLEQIMSSQPIDFIQITYNLRDREVETRILPLAQERGIAVIVNRPYQGGALIQDAKAAKLPAWAAEIGATNWPEFLLKFIVSHPAVTCAIPATSRIEHLRENMAAARGPMPDQTARRRMADIAGQL
jgi:diketogulonate reductase-like aldo/keto reductase